MVATLLATAKVVGRQIRSSDPPPTAVPAHDISPELYHDTVSMYEDSREAHDFIIAVPEIIQRSLQEEKVLIYGQN